MKRLSFVFLSVPLALAIACSSSDTPATGVVADAGPDTAPSGSQCSAAYKDLLLPIEKVSTGAVSVVSTDGDTKTLYIDASAGGLPNAPKNPRVYVNLESGSRVDLGDTAAHASTDWDLAFKRDVIFTNGGDGGPGQGGAVSVEKAFASVTAADGASLTGETFFDGDCNAKKDPTGAVQTTFSDWYDYDEATHIPSPKANHSYVVSSASGVKYKVSIESYNALADGGTGTTYGAYLVKVAPLVKAALGALALVALALVPSIASAAVCNGRPTDASGYAGYSYGAAEVKTYDTPQVRVHYATTGTYAPTLTTTRADAVPDTVAMAGDIAEDALTKYAAMGFKKIPSDETCASNGGDGRLDVYLVAFSGADGSTIAECDGASCSSFVLSKASFFKSGYADEAEGLKTVVTHELFHAVQNVYDHNLDRFWAEGTAQWAMKTLHPELQDFERQLPAFFGDATHSLDALPQGVTSGFLYGAAVWPLFLTLAHGDDVVKLTLEGEADGTKAMDAIDKVLATKGSSVADAFPMFAAWNAATKDLAGTGGYPDAATYPGVKVGALEDGATGITSGFSSFAFSGAIDGSKQITIETDDARNAGVLVPLEGGKARIDKAQKLPAAATGEVLVVVAGITTKKTDAPFTIHFGAPDASSSSSSSGESSSGCVCAASTPSSSDGGTAAFVASVLGLAVVVRNKKKRRA